MAIKRMFDCIEVHEGEPLRIVTSGVPSIPGTSVYDKYIWLKENDIQMCELLTMEPRGVPATCASLIVQSDNPGGKSRVYYHDKRWLCHDERRYCHGYGYSAFGSWFLAYRGTDYGI